MAGLFLALDGIDGVGKSTQLDLLASWLTANGHVVARCRDPGSSAIGESIRQLLLDPQSRMGVLCEMLLYMASRAQLVEQVIRPALAQGHTVLCDRFLTATLAYQGHAGGVDPEHIRQVGMVATDGLLPDWTGILDLDLDSAAGRRGGAADRIESRSVAFHDEVRAGFLAEARRQPERITVIDAAGDPAAVHQAIVAEVRRVLDTTGRP